VVAALSIAGLPTDRFTFEGCLSSKPASRRNELKALARERRTMVFFEAARRLGPTLIEMAAIFGEGRRAAVVREIGKTYEEVVRAKLGELAARFTANLARGEITLVVAGMNRDQGLQEQTGESDLGSVPALSVETLCEAGLSLKQASAVMARLGGRSRREIYQDALASRRTRQDDNRDD
jgi:16S rRNA (cytidine1402-2'-O)-methyltransferase